MLRVAELWREERVQMKLADARAAMEEKMREIDNAVASTTSQHGQQSPSWSQPHPRCRTEQTGGHRDIPISQGQFGHFR